MKRDYMTRLSRIARWKLAPEEAREVVEDYREIISQNPRSEEELYQEVGDPAEAIRLITQKKSYCRWLAAFAVMSVCLLLLAVSPMPGIDIYLYSYFAVRGVNLVIVLIFLLTGLTVSQIWLRRNGFREKGRFPRWIPPLMVLQLAGLIGVWFVIWKLLCTSEESARIFAEEIIYGFVVNLLIGGGFDMALIGMFGLVKARLGDRRWLAVCAQGMTVSALCVAVMVLLWNIKMDWVSDGWQMKYLFYYIFLTAIGLIGTGISLH